MTHRSTRFRLWSAALAVLGVAAIWLGPRLLPASRPSAMHAERADKGGKDEGGQYPGEWFALQRAWPYAEIPQEKWHAAVARARQDRAGLPNKAGGDRIAASLNWTSSGPYNIGGRVTALAVAPGGANVYLGAANGGVFKSVNAGVNWTPIFDEFGIYSIGALELDPSDANVLYVGTGEANSAVDSYDGAGVFKSTNAGTSWQPLGLAETRRIGAIEVDPSNPNRVYVAAMGTQFSTNSDRGLYRSEDGGASWSKTLFLNDSTGVIDIAINPAHPETVYCATWERVRHFTYRRAFGPSCGIWRSTNFGTTWTRLQNGLPAPSDDVGRIGLAIAASSPSTLYAQIIQGAALGYNGLGFYRTTDAGESWTRRDTGAAFLNAFGGFGWYFGETVVTPTNPSIVYATGVNFLRSTDGGVTWVNRTGSAHVDQHALWIDPANPAQLYLGNDGGFFSSINSGANWTKSLDLPITQFYAGTIDPFFPERLFGGTQDNNSIRTPTGATNDWLPMLGGDGFYVLVDPTNNAIVFAESQYASGGAGLLRSTNFGFSGSFIGPSGLFISDRFNWSTPAVMSPHDHNVLLLGSQRVYKSTDNGISYSVVSSDLTRNNTTSLLSFSTLTTLDISPVTPHLYYAGTDDGRVWRSSNGGTGWTEITAGLPIRWVTRVTADPADSNVVYVTHSGFGQDEHLAHVHRSTNRGASWSDIAADLPDVPANDLLVDPANPQRLFLATDVGVYTTANRGTTWYPLGQGMPVQTVFDLALEPFTRKLVAFTHGRSSWSLALAELPVEVASRGERGRFALGSATPNPFRGLTRIELELPSTTVAQVRAFDGAGRAIRELHRGSLAAGRHAIEWNGRDDAGRPVSAGVYFVRATRAGGETRTTRVVKLR
ncbi:MAG: hypothetical protein HOP12_03940 [Candidatus Eisenbacteria bacterium]|uniref:FlgD/Vpr Ig-like domain-containing protein n=1 Tax=Eiseniibacteriota bacterium TaxID=2212470 RepID=A0A849SI98_UNCEI|nr:hypothetical protein [Candidatus Eisenbacteria bacterium]